MTSAPTTTAPTTTDPVESQGWPTHQLVFVGICLTVLTMAIMFCVGEYWTVTNGGTTAQVKVFDVDYWFTFVGVVIGYTVMLSALRLAQTSDAPKGSMGGAQGVTAMCLMVLGGMVLLNVCTTGSFRESFFGRFSGVGKPVSEKPGVSIVPEGTSSKLNFKAAEVEAWFVTFQLPGADEGNLSLPQGVKQGEVWYRNKTKTNSKATEFKLP